jgi:hypothetical protein
MFSVRSEPLLLSEAGIHGLCVSLNTPVLNIEELPIGPARAALVLFDGGYGALGLAVGVRSIDTRQGIVFSYQGTLDMRLTPASAMQDAASFAERMGFLFDDDIVATGEGDGRARALRLWNDLTDMPEVEKIEELDEPALPPLAPAVPLEAEPEELMLDDLAEMDPGPAAGGAADELWLEEVTDSTPVTTDPPAASPRAVPLTKFRQPAPPTAASSRVEPDQSAGAPSLGRIPLVRRRVDGGQEQPAKPGLLLRLLGSF